MKPVDLAFFLFIFPSCYSRYNHGHDAFTIHFPVSKIRTAYICSSELFDI